MALFVLELNYSTNSVYSNRSESKSTKSNVTKLSSSNVQTESQSNDHHLESLEHQSMM